MSDFLGTIEVFTPSVSGTFPLIGNYPWTWTENREVIIHRFLLGDGKTEQRYLVGYPGRVLSFRKNTLCPDERDALVSFWEANQGIFGRFFYNVQQEDNTLLQFIVRFKDQTLSLSGVIGQIMTGGVEFVEVGLKDASNTVLSPPYPNYPLNGTNTRYPGATLSAALLQPVQEVFPLLKITPKKAGYPAIYISDRRCMVGAQLYLARILKRSPIETVLNGASSPVTFTLGNADQSFTLLKDTVNLSRADVEFSLYHVATGIKLDYWKGYIIGFNDDESAEFTITCAEGLYELSLAYPPRKITRQCQRSLGVAGTGCPYGQLIPGGGGAVFGNNRGDPNFCSKDFAGPTGCQSHGMDSFYGGIVAQSETIRVKDNTTGVFGIGRISLTLRSEVATTIYDNVLPEIYCDFSTNPDTTIGLPVNCFLAAGIDEGDFYSALGIVGLGPLGAYAEQTGSNFTAFQLDGQPNHGWPKNDFGLRRSLGHNPVQDNDPDHNTVAFATGQGGSGPQSYEGFKENEADPNWYGGTRAGGVAFVEIRRIDAKGLQVDALASHSMQVTVREGLGGYVWTAPGSNTFKANGLNEPVWIGINAVIRALGLFGNPPLDSTDIAILESVFDVTAAAFVATQICDDVVPVFIGGNPGDTETQFTYTGIFQQQQSLKDWLLQIINSFLGVYVFAFGKIKLYARENASVVSAYTIGNVLLGSTSFQSKDFEFNRLVGHYADQEFLFVDNSVEIYDETHAVFVGREFNPKYLPKDINYSGVSTKSQAARLITTRLREEISGYGKSDRVDKDGNPDPTVTFAYAKRVSFKSTMLAIGDEPGMVVSIETDKAPWYPPTASDNWQEPFPYSQGKPNYAKLRIDRMVLNEDYSMDISGDTVHDDNYALVGGPKPADVIATPLPVPNENAPANWKFFAVTDKKGLLGIRGFAVGTNSLTVAVGYFDIYYIDEANEYNARCIPNDADAGVIPAGHTSFSYEGAPPVPGEWVMLDDEIMLVKSVVQQPSPNEKFGVVTVDRGQFGTVAADHLRITFTVASIDAANSAHLIVPAGLNLRPGSRLIDPDSNETVIASYDRLSGDLYVTLPFPSDPTGLDLYSDVRLWRVKVFNHKVSFPPRFFQTPQLANYADNNVLPQAGVVLIQGKLENLSGKVSNVLTLFPVSDTRLEPKLILPYHPVWPYRVSTYGNHRIVMEVEDLLTGNYLGLFPKVPIAEAQSFASSKATVLKGVGSPIETPPTLQAITPSSLIPTGQIAFTGTPGPALAIQIIVAGNYSFSSALWLASDNGIDGSSTWLDVTASLADWLNTQDPVFSSLYTAAGGFSNVITIQDNKGYGGTLSASTSGGSDVDTFSTGFFSRLGVKVGRKYALAYTGAGFRSALSPLSVSSGPSGDATYFTLRNIPFSVNTDVTSTEIYATPEGQESPLRLIGTLSTSATVYSFLDAVTEAALAGNPVYPGVSQPNFSDDCTIIVKKRDTPWYQLYIPANSNMSNEVHGFALDPVTTDVYITADVNNNIENGSPAGSPPAPVGIDLAVELN